MSAQHMPLAEAVDELLRSEATRTEQRVAVIRVAAYGSVAAVDAVLLALGLRPALSLLTVVPFVALSVLFLVAVRRQFDPSMKFVAPLLDALFITALVNVRIEALGLHFGIVATAALACGLFAATGGVRYDRAAGLWTTALSLLTFVATVGWREKPSDLVYALPALAALGLLSAWQSSLARRALAGDRGRETLKRFLSDEVVDRAFTDPHGLADARPREAVATVLVSDLRGFTALSERLPPTEVLELLSEVQTALAEAVGAHSGVVDKFLGDGMLATFNAVRPVDAHPEAAVRCARDILVQLERINALHPERPHLRVAMGVHTGPLVVGTVGRRQRMEFTVIGDAVNVASRLEALCKEWDTPLLVSEDALAPESRPQLALRGEVTLRGRTARTRVYGLAAEPSVAHPG